MKKVLFLISMLGLPVLSFAASGHVADANAAYDYYKTLADWAAGPLGVGLATTMLLMGGAIGVAKCSPMPTLSGVAGAAFLHWMPAIVLGLVTPPQVAPNTAHVVATSATHATVATTPTLTSKVAVTQSAQVLAVPTAPVTAHLNEAGFFVRPRDVGGSRRRCRFPESGRIARFSGHASQVQRDGLYAKCHDASWRGFYRPQWVPA
jgi:conjugal transfer pilus assembly protein TraA